MTSRTRRMKRLQARMKKEQDRRKVSNRRLAPDYDQRLQALKMEGKATFVHPKDMPQDSPNYQRWARENCTCATATLPEDGPDRPLPSNPNCPVHGVDTSPP